MTVVNLITKHYGESPEVVIKALGMSRARIYEWLAAYREGGFDALKAKQISGRPKKLSGAQIRELYIWITTFTPDQLKFDFALWTRGRVRELIRQKFNVRLSDVSVGRLLRNLGMTPQKARGRETMERRDLPGNSQGSKKSRRHHLFRR